MKLKIRKLHKQNLQEFIQLLKVFEDVFEMKDFTMPQEEHLQNLLADEKFMVFVAVDENEKAIGGLTAYTLTQYYSTHKTTVEQPSGDKGIRTL